MVIALPLKAAASAPPVVSLNVWNEERLEKLRALNKVVRWLRQNGITPLTQEYNAPRPWVLVHHTAAEFLSKACGGKNTLRAPSTRMSFSYVLIDGCEIDWFSRGGE